MKNYLLFFTFFISLQLFAQNNIEKTKKDTTPLSNKPLTPEKFATAVKTDFNSLLGNDEESLNNAFETSFNKDETSVTAKFFLANNKINNRNTFKNLITGKVKLGESNNVFDLSNTKMPFIELSIKYNRLFNTKWYYNKKSEIKNPASKKIIIAKDSLMDTAKQIYFYQLERPEMKNDWTSMKYRWISLEFNYTNAKYKIFDITKPFDEQIFDEIYSNASGIVGYNYYRKWIKSNKYWKNYIRPHYFYFNMNYQFKDGNNIKKFDKVTVTDYEQVTSGGVTREIETSQTAYKGMYKTFNQHNFSSEILIGILKNVSLDLFSNVQISEEDSPLWTFGGGFYFMAKNKKEETKVNLGIFIKKEGKDKPFIGFKTSLPITL